MEMGTFEEDLKEHGVEAKSLIETSSKEILKQFASNGLGVAFIPDMTATREVENGSLKRLDWRGSSFPIIHRYSFIKISI